MLSAGGRQMLGLNDTGTCTCPTNTSGIIDGCELNLLVENSCMGVMAVLYLYDVIFNANVFSVLTYDVVLIGQTSHGIISRPSTRYMKYSLIAVFCSSC